MIKYNDSRRSKTNQEWLLENPFPHENIRDNIPLIKEDLSGGEITILNYLIGIHCNKSQIYCSQETISNKTGYSVRQVYNITESLKSKGYLATRYRHMKSLLYKVSSFLFKPDVIKLAKGFLWALKYYIPLSLLVSTSNKCEISEDKRLPQENCRQYNIRQVYLYTSSLPKKLEYNMELRKSQENCQIFENLKKFLNLTEKGAEVLSIFSREALEYGWENVRRVKNIRDKFKWFFVACRNYSKNNNLGINWSYYYSLGVDRDTLFYEKPEVKMEIPQNRGVRREDVYKKRITALEIAREISKIVEGDISQLACLIGKTAAYNYRMRMISNLINGDYVLTQEEHEESALLYIDHYRDKLNRILKGEIVETTHLLSFSLA